MLDWLVRAGKTFVQAAVPIFIANASLIGNHLVAWDWCDWKGWLLPILLSAIAAGISAVWNLILEAWNSHVEKKQANLDNIAAMEEKIAMLEQALALANKTTTTTKSKTKETTAK